MRAAGVTSISNAHEKVRPNVELANKNVRMPPRPAIQMMPSLKKKQDQI